MTASRLVLSAAEVDLATGVVQRGDGVAATLTPTERALLGFLAGQPGQTVPRDTLLEAVWGYRPGVRSRTLDTAIKVVRRKIERDPAEPDHLATVRGVGYRFDPPRASTGFDPGGLGADAPLYGRDAALAAIDRALADGARVVTVRGPGGIGKTRLARAAIRGRRSRWADLGAAIDDADVVAAVAGAVSPGAPLRDGDDVGRRLAGIGVVCLDGCEAGAAAIAARVARWTAGVFLVTSRVALGVDGERTIELGPLDDGAAVALLVERASTRRPAFGRSDPAVLAAIVAAVDRVPLGIELVAARAGLLDAPALLDRLTRRAARPGPFDWLAADDSRHGSLAATVDWSWGLLPADARIVLAACAVFAGGFRVEAAEAVCGPLVDGPVLPRLELLRDASLLRADHDRLEAWAMVRAFADDHATDRPGCEDRLGDWLAQALPDAPIGRVTAELANLRVALAAAVARRRPVAAALAESLERALASTGPMAARLRAADVAVDTASTPDRRARALVARARARDIVGADGVDADLDAARSLAPDRSTLGRVELAAGPGRWRCSAGA
ncbi:MAG: winged helix-turn-helix domain-containing protein [Myxococcota bacterium]